jgi:RNA polymerase sigma-70 factor, ECF subfamily
MDELTKLAVAAQRGDRAALSNLVRRTQADVWRFCAHLNGRDHADDLTQETYSRAIGSLHRFRGDSEIRSWLLSIARRVCADHVRSAVRRRSLMGRLRPTSETYEPSGSVELWEIVGDLDPDRREAFVLTQVLGLSYDEAAGVCGCPIGTIRSRVARARADLVEQLEPGQASANG